MSERPIPIPPLFTTMTSPELSERAVEDDPSLLKAMIDDAMRTSDEWRPTPYWRGYADRVLAELNRSGLENLRTNARLLKGYAIGGTPKVNPPRAPWKRLVWHALSRLPGVRTIIAEHERLVDANHHHAVEARVAHARLALDRIAVQHPGIAPPGGLANGGAEDAFEWRGHRVTSDWVRQLGRITDFYALTEPGSVRSLLEIGPGLGLSTLAHRALNPALELVVNIDIAPVLYVSTQFLKSFDGMTVIDYAATRHAESIEPVADGALTVYQLAPWQMPKLSARLDFFFNAFSFQEMEPDICANYAEHAKRLCTAGAVLHNSLAGNMPVAGGQRQPVTLAGLIALFADRFPRQTRLDGVGPELFDIDPATAILLRP